MDHQLKFFVKYRYFIGILTEFLESGKKTPALTNPLLHKCSVTISVSLGEIAWQLKKNMEF